MFRRLDLIDWLGYDGDEDMLSPKYCSRCYAWLLDHYEEGDGDIEGLS